MIAIVAMVIAAVVAFLFASGFWSANVKSGSLPKVDVSAKGGSLPAVDVQSKQLVVGTTQTKVDVPKVKTEKETISVPTIGVRDGNSSH